MRENCNRRRSSIAFDRKLTTLRIKKINTRDYSRVSTKWTFHRQSVENWSYFSFLYVLLLFMVSFVPVPLPGLPSCVF
jgi:hypothetical protein